MASETQGSGGAEDILYSGTYTNGIVLNNPATQNPATIAASGLVANSGTAIYGEPGTAWTVANYGTVEATGTLPGAGIELASGGLVINGQGGSPGGLIAGSSSRALAFGVEITGTAADGSAGTVVNYGTIRGEVTISLYGSREGYGVDYYPTAAGSVVNFGTIASSYFGQGANLAQTAIYAAVVTNYGTIVGRATGVVTNFATIAGGDIRGTLVNYGLITDTQSPVSPEQVIYAASGAITNYGTIESMAGSGVFLPNFGNGGDILVNSGFVQGGDAGVSVLDQSYPTLPVSALIVNYGTIEGSIGLTTTLNPPGGSPTGSTTVTNAGTIIGTGGTAVYFSSSADQLVAYPGAVFRGAVVGYDSTLELAAGYGPGRLPGLGVKFTGFATVNVDYGSVWKLTGAGSDHRIVNDGTIAVSGEVVTQRQLVSDPGDNGVVLLEASGVARFAGAVGAGETVAFTGNGGTMDLARPLDFSGTIGGFGAGDTIDLVKNAADGLSFGNGHLTVTNQGVTVADLAFAGNYTAADFALSPDDHGGTEITFAAGAHLLAMKGG